MSMLKKIVSNARVPSNSNVFKFSSTYIKWMYAMVLMKFLGNRPIHPVGYPAKFGSEIITRKVLNNG